MKTRFNIIIIIALLSLIYPGVAFSICPAPNATNYMAAPPFIVANIKPNLLLMFDNSASMYDLAYISTGTYCYDNSYNSNATYVGYFESETIYEYDMTNNYFYVYSGTSFPNSCTGGTTYLIPDTLLLCVKTNVSPYELLRFAAKGKYLNWLTASKFDVQKAILTGGKYTNKFCSTTTDMVCNTNADCPSGETCNITSTWLIAAESRGCVGRKFIKEAMFNSTTPLGITFGIRGPEHPFNDTLPSAGGQTYIDIFMGNYNEGLCQAAIDAYIAGHDPASIKQAVDDCLSATTSPSAYCQLDPAKTCTKDSDCTILGAPWKCIGSGGNKKCDGGPREGQSCNNNNHCNYIGPCVTPTATTESKQKVVFNQSIQACWAFKKGTPIGIDEVNTVKNQCSDLYDENKVCNGGPKDGKVCSTNSDCPGGTCVNGPGAIEPGNPSLLCSTTYAGYCAFTSNNWTTTTWVSREYSSSDECIIEKHEKFCGDVQVPPVIDPSDDPSTTENYDNLPAIISDIGVEAQLGQPIKSLSVRIKVAGPPTGLIHQFKDLIRFGAMSFNNFGSLTECPGNIPCTKVCSTSRTVCSTDLDCPGESCIQSNDYDAGKVIHHIGYVGNIPDESIGDHSSGLINAIDSIRAQTWTPYAEGFYNAIGYFAGRTDLRLNSGDFDSNKNPSQYKCQQNHILLITDGMSTADRNTSVYNLVSSYNDGDGHVGWTATSPKFAGSLNLDDLAWLAKNRSIKDFSRTPLPTDEDYNSVTITTHVVYTGAACPAKDTAGNCTTTDESVPEKLMQETAKNGGGLYRRAEDPSQLRQALYEAFLAISGSTASGTAVSVLATTGEGEGAVYQAYFYPKKRIGNSEVKWAGYIQGLFVDAYGNLREDTNSDDTLAFANDRALKMWYDGITKTTYLDRFVDGSPADGKIDCYDKDEDGRTVTSGECTFPDAFENTIPFDNITPIWEAGRLLFSRMPETRKIYTSITGNSFTVGLNNDSTMGTFYDGNKSILRPYLRASSDEEAANIINYIRGTDISGYRTRMLTIDGTTNTWKLGDIVYSSPVAAAKPMENFDFRYKDQSYAEFKAALQTRRGVVYVGANDGMLHAFNAGYYDKTNHRFYDPYYRLGEELWAFIPTDLLPHLLWLTDPNYAHTYYVDAKPRIADVRIFTPDETHKNGWGTILIGGMRFGGKDICVDFPSGSSTFRSSYFAIDVTDPLNPRLLWTFTDTDLGLTLGYPAIVRIRTDPSKSNSEDPGHWFVVFGSGPTSYDGSSTNLGRVYALDLNSGTNGVISGWTLDTNYWKFSTGDSNAFMSDAIAVDVNTDYTHDVVYIGETYNFGGIWKGKMFRLVTKGTTPSFWTLSTLFNPGKPVTAPASASKDAKGNLWVFFGTGKFLHTNDKTTTDSQAFYGIKDVCKPWLLENYGCTDTVLAGDLLETTNAVVSAGGGSVTGVDVPEVKNWATLLSAINGKNGWYLNFSHSGERNYVKPLILGGLVVWATYIPNSDICTPEGDSYVYAVYYETGTAYKEYVFVEEKMTQPETVGSVKYLGKGAPSSLVGMITKKGTAKGLAQTSTGAIKEIEFETAMKTHGFKGWKAGEIK